MCGNKLFLFLMTDVIHASFVKSNSVDIFKKKLNVSTSHPLETTNVNTLVLILVGHFLLFLWGHGASTVGIISTCFMCSNRCHLNRSWQFFFLSVNEKILLMF